MTTKLVLAYAAGLHMVRRAMGADCGGTAVDLACGPGHYTLCLARYLGYDSVIGVDLSPPMVHVAAENARGNGLHDKVRFQVGDVTKLHEFPNRTLNLSSFTDAAHHLSDLQAVQTVLREMDRITKSEGLVMAMDVARLRTARLTERYAKSLGEDYAKRGLRAFYDDFYNSMYAAWTPEELRSAIPRDTARRWFHLVPRGLPSVQIILGLPVGRTKTFVDRGFATKTHPLIRDWYDTWQEQVGPRWAKDTLREWSLLRAMLSVATRRCIQSPG